MADAPGKTVGGIVATLVVLATVAFEFVYVSTVLFGGYRWLSGHEMGPALGVPVWLVVMPLCVWATLAAFTWLAADTRRTPDGRSEPVRFARRCGRCALVGGTALALVAATWVIPAIRVFWIHVASVGGERMVSPLARLLTDADPGVRRAAADALGKAGAAAGPAAPALAQALRDPVEEVRWAAGAALGRLGAPAVPVFVAALAEGDASARRQAAAGLGELGAQGRPAGDTLRDHGRDPDPGVRMECAAALCRVLDDPAEGLALLGEALRAGDRESCQAAIACAAALAGKAEPLRPALLSVLARADAGLRLCAVEALGRIGLWQSPLIDELARYGSDPDPQVAQAVRELVARYRPAGTIPRATVGGR